MYIPAWTAIIIMLLVFAVGNLLTYFIGVSQGHFRPVFPYISNTGANPIESGVFVLVFAITAFFNILIIYIRFKDLYTNVEGICYRIANVIFLIIGLIAAFSLMGVAAFRADESSLSNRFHSISAGLTIFLNFIYSLGQAFLGLFLRRVRWKRLIFAIQLIIIIFGTIPSSYFLISLFLPSYLYYDSIGTNTSSIETNSTLLAMYNQGLAIDYSRAVVEWIIFVDLLLFYATLIPDFHRIRISLEVTRPFDESSDKDNSHELKRV